APHFAAAQPRFDGLVVFGTSLSDPGNAFALRGGTNTPPDYDVDPFLVPSTPYARGGHHFSDGATWVEQLARSLGQAASANPALANQSKKAANYAVGGARANDRPDTFDLAEQTGAFLSERGGVAPGGALYVVEMGGNDVRDAIAAFVGAGGGINGQLAAQAVIGGALQSIGDNIFALYRAGARKFLVWNAPNLGLTPAIRALDSVSPGAAALADALTVGFNQGLEFQVLAGLSGLPGIEIVRFDVYGRLQAIVADPSAFGLTNVTDACITPQSAPYHCKEFRDYLFWDGIHPTAAAHGIVAQQVREVLP
ncbi:MAG TPA: SGNH/GDSL hydrolase family protein, partial [Burkholderiales bacterium]|nr:SGNH/GDSL hydrolase family protein [Burkholderiales bacterium]